MLRTPLDKSYIKRTIQPLYAATQATPKSGFLDPAWDRSVDIYPGMALQRSGGDLVTLLGGNTPYALSAFYAAPVLGIDEIKFQGVNACAYWVLDPDAEFQIESPAFDSTVTWTDPTDGTTTLVSAYKTGAKRGQLCPLYSTGTTVTTGAATSPIARLLKVVSATKIIVGGLQPGQTA